LLVDVDLNKDMYIGTLNTAGLKDILVDDEWVRKYKGLLEGGMWGLVRLERNEDSSKYPVMVGKFALCRFQLMRLRNISRAEMNLLGMSG
jgi:ATP-dependent Lon protease